MTASLEGDSGLTARPLIETKHAKNAVCLLRQTLIFWISVHDESAFVRHTVPRSRIPAGVIADRRADDLRRNSPRENPYRERRFC